jgi:hypothetical protein
MNKNKRTVCIAGYDKDGECIRPTLRPPGISEESIISNNKPIIFPFAKVEFDLQRMKSDPPHIEDYRFKRNSPKFVGTVEDPQAHLEYFLFPNVADIFEQEIHIGPGYYVLEGLGARSLGTIKPSKFYKVIFEKDISGMWDYRVSFKDENGEFFRLKIVDLTWQYYCRDLRNHLPDQKSISAKMSRVLRSSSAYFRIGLARNWNIHPGKCFLQITGIYTFPDYLEGKTFCDFR